jgi:peptidyl-prolyl cis-trans isomerase C
MMLTVAAIGFAVPGFADDKVLATVNGQSITDTDLQALMASLGPQLSQVPEAARPRAALDRLIDMRVLSDEAKKDGLDKAPEYLARLETIRQQLLISEFVKDKIEASVTDADVKARYDKEVAGFAPPEELRARHILVKTKEEADDIIKQLNAGADFSKLATEKSQDPGSAAKGGDLDYFSAGDMVAPFEEAAQKLKVGEYTKEPVQTQFGWHVIQLEDRRKQKAPEFDSVKDQIRQTIVGEKFAEALQTLKKASKIDIKDASLAGPAATPTAPAQTPPPAATPAPAPAQTPAPAPAK